MLLRNRDSSFVLSVLTFLLFQFAASSPAFADRLYLQDDFHTFGRSELARYSFGFDQHSLRPCRCPCSAQSPGRPSRSWNTDAWDIDRWIPKSMESLRDLASSYRHLPSRTLLSLAERLSVSLIDALQGALGDYFGGSAAHAKSNDSVDYAASQDIAEALARGRDGLVHF